MDEIVFHALENVAACKKLIELHLEYVEIGLRHFHALSSLLAVSLRGFTVLFSFTNLSRIVKEAHEENLRKEPEKDGRHTLASCVCSMLQ